MPVVCFKGRVLPESSGLTVTGLPTIEFKEPPYPPELPNGLVIKYSVSIDRCAVEMVCDAEPFILSWVHNRATNVIRALVDLYSFGAGIPLAVMLDRLIDEHGNESKIRFDAPHLNGICTVMQVNGAYPGSVNFGKTLDLAIQDTAIAATLRDLVSAITYVDQSVINAARAVDGLREILWPHEDDKKKGWELLQQNLQLGEDYIKYITKISEKARHGNREHIPGGTINEVTKRSWIIMNRFLEYRLRGNKPLSLTEFPLL